MDNATRGLKRLIVKTQSARRKSSEQAREKPMARNPRAITLVACVLEGEKPLQSILMMHGEWRAGQQPSVCATTSELLTYQLVFVANYEMIPRLVLLLTWRFRACYANQTCNNKTTYVCLFFILGATYIYLHIRMPS